MLHSLCKLLLLYGSVSLISVYGTHSCHQQTDFDVLSLFCNACGFSCTARSLSLYSNWATGSPSKESLFDYWLGKKICLFSTVPRPVLMVTYFLFSGYLTRVRNTLVAKLTAHFHLVKRLRMSGAIPSSPTCLRDGHRNMRDSMIISSLTSSIIAA